MHPKPPVATLPAPLRIAALPEVSLLLSWQPGGCASVKNAAGHTGSRPGDPADDGCDRYLQAIDRIACGESREQDVTRGRNRDHERLGIALAALSGWLVFNGPEATVVPQLKAVELADDDAASRRRRR